MPEVRRRHLREGEVGPSHIGIPKRRTPQIRPMQTHTDRRRITPVRTGDAGPSKVRAPEAGTFQIQIGQHRIARIQQRAAVTQTGEQIQLLPASVASTVQNTNSMFHLLPKRTSHLGIRTQSTGSP